jgi:hypothetical protein
LLPNAVRVLGLHRLKQLYHPVDAAALPCERRARLARPFDNRIKHSIRIH